MDSLSTGQSTGGKLVVVGDFNIPMDSISCTDTTKFKDLLYSLSLIQHVNMPTHQHGHILDLVITRSFDNCIQNIITHPAVMSDHSPLTFQCSIDKPAAVKKVIKTRKLKDIDINAFRTDINNTPLVRSPTNSIEDLVQHFNATMSALLNKHAPLITKEVFVRPNSPWYTEEIKHAKQLKRQAERRWQASHLAINLELFKSARAHFNKLCREAKCAFYQSKITDSAGDNRKIFNIANHLLHHKQEISLPSHNEPGDLANKFSSFFYEKIQKIRSSFLPVDLDALPVPSSADRPTIASFQPISEAELKKVILSGNSKSCHLDPLPTSLLKDCIECLLPTLTCMVNRSLTSCTVPAILKSATVTPLLKKSSLDHEEMRNY
jgi:hypothetical protein